MPIVYILQSQSNSKFYSGSSHTDNPDQRLKEHNAGRVRSTQSGRPWRLVYKEFFTFYAEARKRENFLKTGVGRKWIYEQFRDNP